ncbi:MAG: reverse transcriptase domain-containing protein [archaeon]
MKTYNNLYQEICSMNNLANAWRNARKGKTKKKYVIEFEENTRVNLLELRNLLLSKTYSPRPLKIFILRDPKTRKISKSDFTDRIVHYALIRVIEPIFDKVFIYDSCANRKGKGNLFAIERFNYFKKKVTDNLHSEGFCLKADIKHYFDTINHEILFSILKKKISDERVLWLIKNIMTNKPDSKIVERTKAKGMPLGNLTSQFFANVYLSELDYFIKHQLKARYYLRYVDDFVILHKSKIQLNIWMLRINKFLKKELKLELHPDKSKVISLSKSIDFVGFRNFYHHRLLRKRNIRKILFKIKEHNKAKLSQEKIFEIFQGWNAYSKWANSYKLRIKVSKKLILGFKSLS